ncbi:MAG: hypothetical protein VCA37_14360, partial [Roseibacillus sp.]
TTSLSTVTDASETRCRMARMGTLSAVRGRLSVCFAIQDAGCIVNAASRRRNSIAFEAMPPNLEGASSTANRIALCKY